MAALCGDAVELEAAARERLLSPRAATGLLLQALPGIRRCVSTLWQPPPPPGDAPSLVARSSSFERLLKEGAACSQLSSARAAAALLSVHLGCAGSGGGSGSAGVSPATEGALSLLCALATHLGAVPEAAHKLAWLAWAARRRGRPAAEAGEGAAQEAGAERSARAPPFRPRLLVRYAEAASSAVSPPPEGASPAGGASANALRGACSPLASPPPPDASLLRLRASDVALIVAPLRTPELGRSLCSRCAELADWFASALLGREPPPAGDSDACGISPHAWAPPWDTLPVGAKAVAALRSLMLPRPPAHSQAAPRSTAGCAADDVAAAPEDSLLLASQAHSASARASSLVCLCAALSSPLLRTHAPSSPHSPPAAAALLRGILLRRDASASAAAAAVDIEGAARQQAPAAVSDEDDPWVVAVAGWAATVAAPAARRAASPPPAAQPEAAPQATAHPARPPTPPPHHLSTAPPPPPLLSPPLSVSCGAAALCRSSSRAAASARCPAAAELERLAARVSSALESAVSSSQLERGASLLGALRSIFACCLDSHAAHLSSPAPSQRSCVRRLCDALRPAAAAAAA